MITYETGTPHFGGRTVVRLSANGEVLVEQNCGGRHSGFNEKADPAVYREILVLLRKARRSVADLPEPVPVPGETRVRLRAATPSETIDLEFWSNQRWRDPAVDRLISRLERLAVESSGGIIRF
ncbi:MAG: hypothetical protein JO015_11540 [Verrucomicrobia bacterium]|nr:hypothetical protein [Verrucomicrobiota bacterium]